MRTATQRSRPRVLAWLPGLSAHGGIERHNRFLCSIISDWCRERGGHLEVVSLFDPDGWSDSQYLDRPVRGAAGSTVRFGLHAVGGLIPRCDLLIVGVKDFGPLIPAAKMRSPSLPILTIAHGVEVWRRLSAAERLAFTAATRVFCVSEDTARNVIDVQQAKSERVTVIPTPIDPHFVAAYEAFKASGRPPIDSDLLSISRVNVNDADKGVDTVIRALPAIRDAIGPIRYSLVGDGTDRPRLEQLVDELGVRPMVEFAGRISDDELHARLAGTKVFVLPSAKEGFGIVYLEAMLYGRAVIAGAHGGVPEVVDAGRTGSLVDRSDVGGLARHCIELLKDPERREAFGMAGAQRVREHFLAPGFIAQVRSLLGQLVPVSNDADD